MIKAMGALAPVLLLAACASSGAVQTSQNTAIISARAAPICGGVGAAQVAQKQAAIETLRAGYDRYIIEGGAAANNVRVTQVPGSASTFGSVYGNTFSATTIYQPRTIISGGHEQSFAIRMFREGEPGASMAISARETLGPDWQQVVADGTVRTCG